MPLLRRALAAARTLIVVLGIGVTASAAAARAAGGTSTRATVKVSHLVDADRTHVRASRGGRSAASLGIEDPYGIAAGPDGALWFTNSSSIGRITTSGTVTIYTDPSIDNSNGITAGPDGALCFTSSGNNKIGRIDPATGTVTSYTDPAWVPVRDHGGAGRGAVVHRQRGNTIGRVDPATGKVTTYTDPSIAQPVGITARPDGAVWFTNSSGGRPSIGRITTSGTVTIYSYNPSATTLTAAPNPSSYGQPVTFTATVSPSDGGGTVAFSASGNRSPDAPASPHPGQRQQLPGHLHHRIADGRGHTISAAYSGAPSYTPSAANLT